MVQTRRGLRTEIQAKSPSKAPTKAKKVVRKPSDVPKTPPPKSRGKAKSPSPAKSPKPPPAKSRLVNGKRLLFSLQDDDELLEATLVCRPSKRNKSPYVGDIQVAVSSNDDDGITPTLQTPNPLVHLPNLDMGGKCRPGVKLLVKPSRDRKGQKISASATGKYGTPKCQYSAQLLWVDESAFGQILDDNNNEEAAVVKGDTSISSTLYPPVWVGAHPSLGERIAEVWLREGLIKGIPAITKLERQVTRPGDADMRADFLVHHADHSRRIVEIKTVVDTDYAASHVPPKDSVKCVFTSPQTTTRYQRTAIFPWGSCNQKGPEGEKVVSARAIHHVQELTKLAQGKLREQVVPKQEDQEEKWDGTYQSTLLFVVIRGDAVAFRPNRDACPSFAKHVAHAKEQGVQVLAKRVCWGKGKDELGHCYDDQMLPIQWE